MKNYFTWIAFALCLRYSQQQGSQQWTYEDGEYGPDAWPQQFEQCRGVRQSPVHIHHVNVQHNPKLTPFFFGGHDNIGRLQAVMSNSGKAVVVKLSEAQYIEDGGLKGRYIATQFHFHWGKDASRGSEHVLNMRRYPMELHIVHYAEKYGNLSTAIGKSDGLAVLSLLFEMADEDNVHFNSLAERLGRIKEPAQKVEVDEFCLKTIFPGNMKNFYRYRGSLTTPPCQESVIWTIFTDTIKISDRQLSAFRSLHMSEGTQPTPDVHTIQGRRQFITNVYMGDNYRPLQELNGRSIYSSFKPEMLEAVRLTGGSSAIVPTSIAVWSCVLVFLISAWC